MPELPEVETFVRELQAVVSDTIDRVDVLDDRLGFDAMPLAGATIASIARRGKHIVIRLRNRGDLVVHLRMSGRLRLRRSVPERVYTRLTVHLDSGRKIYFVNPRRLGTVRYYPEGFQTRLGVEPLEPEFTCAALETLTRASQSPIKMLLMDQRKIAGIGNIYAAEALWRSGISPARRASTLSRDENVRLHGAVVSVLREAIDQQGTSLGDGVSDYVTPSGQQGEFRNHLSVYGREDEPCERCGGIIVRMKQGGRSTYYCSQCQH